MSLDRSLWLDLIGVPYAHGGRGPDSFDCYGLLLELHRRQGIAIAPIPAPGDDRGIDDAVSRFLPHWAPCPIAPGTTLLFLDDGMPRHVGIALDEDRFIHAAIRNGQVAIDHLSRTWGRLLIGAYRPITRDL